MLGFFVTSFLSFWLAWLQLLVCLGSLCMQLLLTLRAVWSCKNVMRGLYVAYLDYLPSVGSLAVLACDSLPYFVHWFCSGWYLWLLVRAFGSGAGSGGDQCLFWLAISACGLAVLSLAVIGVHSCSCRIRCMLVTLTISCLPCDLLSYRCSFRCLACKKKRT